MFVVLVVCVLFWYLLRVVCCLSLVVRCLLLVDLVRCVLFVVRGVLVVVCCLLWV